MQSAGLCIVQNSNMTLQPNAQQQQMQRGSSYGYINPLTSNNPYNPNLYGNQSQSSQLNQNSLRSLSRYGNLGPSSMIPLPPEPLTDFQKFVASTAQQVLPIFGASLFNQVPSTFSPLDQGPVPSNYVLGVGDQVRVQVWGQVNFSTETTIDRTGGIYLPQIGEVHLAGTPAASLAKVLRDAVSHVFRNFHLTASVGQIRSIQVYVVGDARRPGVYTISSLSTLVDALFASGGPSPDGSMRNIEVRRDGKIITHFDLYHLLLSGERSNDVPLHSGDVIFIPPVGPQAAITGSVQEPAIYELRKGETIGQLIKNAGGSSAIAAKTYISIDRIVGHRDREAMQVSFNEAGLSTPVESGDLIRIHSIVPLFKNTVTLRGNTANPGRFAWHPGMRLSDLIPDRASLVTRNYWWRRAQMGLPAPRFEPLESYPTLMQPNRPFNLRTGEQASLQGRQSTEQTQSELQQENSSQTNASQTVSSLASAAQVRTENTLGATPPLTVRLPAPDIDWSYAVIERLNPKTLKTELIPFDLGKLVMDHDASQNLLLQPGDIVTIFSQGDIHVPLEQQTKFVRLEGEFKHAGVYSAKPGETLRELVQQAGGLTKDAYLYGSSFTRVSTRVLQQERLNQYVQNLSLEIQRNTLNAANSGASSAQNLATATTAQTQEQQLLRRLQQIHATGRIVLNMKPDSHGVAGLPNIVLQDGDRFVVPAVPSTVNVVGAVYDQSSFLYSQGRRVGDYLRLAGGENRDADRRHEFLIRADGSVVSKVSSHTIFGNDFRSLPVYPGDTIVVPEKLYKPSRILGVLQYSQLFSQLALGAASINVIK
jgi:protein involved in polysaccharide export with SLBB domain